MMMVTLKDLAAGNIFFDLRKIYTCIFVMSVSSLAYSHGSENKAKHRYGHVGRRGHTHKESKFTLALGASISQTLATQKSASMTNSNKGELAMLDEGHGDHDDEGSGDDSNDDSKPGFAPFFGARMGYLMTKNYALNLTAGYFTNTGIADPTAGITATFPYTSRIKGVATLNASAPMSKVSKDSYKITTLNATAGPQARNGRWTLGLNAIFATSWYYKTVIVEEENKQSSSNSTGSFALLHGDDGDSHGGADGNTSFPEDSEGTGDREFNRYGGKASCGYKLFKEVRFDAALGLAMVTHQFGPATWVSDATVGQFTYALSDWSGFVGLALRKEASSISAPSSPSIGAGIEYLIN